MEKEKKETEKKSSEEKPVEPKTTEAKPEENVPHTDDKFVSGYKKVKSAITSPSFDHLFAVKWVDKFLNWYRALISPETFESIANWCRKYGHTGLIASAAVSFIFWLIVAIKVGPFMLYTGYGLACAVFLLILQYTASKFINAGEALIKSSTSRMASASFLDCFAVLMEVIGVALLVISIQNKQFIPGLAMMAFCDVIALTALHPSLLNVKIQEDVAAGEEAIEILSFFMKSAVKIVPLVFGIGSILGLIGLTWITIKLPFSGDSVGLAYMQGKQILLLIIGCVCLPLASYVLFVFYHLALDLLRAILVLPGKLDDLKK